MTMQLLSGILSLYKFFRKDTPLRNYEGISTFGHFLCYDELDQQWQATNTWKAVLTNINSFKHKKGHISQIDLPRKLSVVTWNINSASPMPEARLDSIFTSIIEIQPAVDVVCFQEVSRLALLWLMAHSGIQKEWFCTQIEGTDWGKSKFITITLLSRRRFVCHGQHAAPGQLVLGRTWRTLYESRFERDALCCDVFGSWEKPPDSRLRLINVHLDSLPLTPSYRPGQVKAVADLLKIAGGGFVAGDFNPVLPEDQEGVSKHGLLDAWLEKRPDEPGFTWGHNHRVYPAGRLDKILVDGMKVSDIKLMKSASLPMSTVVDGAAKDPTVESMREKDYLEGRFVESSDHWGIWCALEIPELPRSTS